MYAGGCLCGRVKYAIDGPVKRTSHCHCRMCQKQHGAAFASYANVASADFAYVEGAPEVTAYESSPGVTRCFCKVCGSNLTWQMAAHKDRIAVSLGTFDTPYEGKVGQEFHEDSRASWLE